MNTDLILLGLASKTAALSPNEVDRIKRTLTGAGIGSAYWGALGAANYNPALYTDEEGNVSKTRTQAALRHALTGGAIGGVYGYASHEPHKPEIGIKVLS